eukprot:1159681-Pelagomonas_calceolata.AAC.1
MMIKLCCPPLQVQNLRLCPKRRCSFSSDRICVWLNASMVMLYFELQVLAMAGYGAEEAHSIYAQVDTDKGGSVELEEFEAWWIESQRQHVSTT